MHFIGLFECVSPCWRAETGMRALWWNHLHWLNDYVVRTNRFANGPVIFCYPLRALIEILHPHFHFVILSEFRHNKLTSCKESTWVSFENFNRDFDYLGMKKYNLPRWRVNLIRIFKCTKWYLRQLLWLLWLNIKRAYLRIIGKDCYFPFTKIYLLILLKLEAIRLKQEIA